jgi:hypothetical protein
MKVFKYQILPGQNILMIPEPAKLLSVTTQNDKIYLYALVDEEEKEVKRFIRVIMTGQAADLFDSEYIGTVMLEGGKFVLHAFEENEVDR